MRDARLSIVCTVFMLLVRDSMTVVPIEPAECSTGHVVLWCLCLWVIKAFTLGHKSRDTASLTPPYSFQIVYQANNTPDNNKNSLNDIGAGGRASLDSAADEMIFSFYALHFMTTGCANRLSNTFQQTDVCGVLRVQSAIFTAVQLPFQLPSTHWFLKWSGLQ